MSIVTNDNDNIAGFYPTTPSRSFSDDTVSRAARYQQHCANGDRPSQWEMVNFGPYKIQTPQPIAKNCHSWLQLWDEPLCQFRCKSFYGEGFWSNGWNIMLNYFYIHIPFLATITGRPMLMRDDSKDTKSRKDVPFWCYKN